MKNGFKIWISIVLTCVLAFSLFACTATTAYWQNQTDDTQGIETDIADANGSAKYIIYAALNASGNLITRPAEGEPEATVSYAVVGYTGIVAELVIPAQYNGKNVVKVLHLSSRNDNGVVKYPADYVLSSNDSSYTGEYAALRNNEVVTSIVFGSYVAYVDAGACAGMTKLTSVKFECSSAVALGNAAFSACTALTSVTGTWTPSPSTATPFVASGYTPPSP